MPGRDDKAKIDDLFPVKMPPELQQRFVQMVSDIDYSQFRDKVVDNRLIIDKKGK